MTILLFPRKRQGASSRALTYHLRYVRTANTSESKPSLSLAVNSIAVCSATTTKHLSSLRTANTLESKPYLSLAINSTDVCSAAAFTPTDLLIEGKRQALVPNDCNENRYN